MKIHGGIELDNFEHGVMIASQSAHGFNPEFDHVVSRTSKGNLLGGVIYQSYMHASIVLHVASWDACWLSRDMLWAIFAFPFKQLSVKKCLGFVPSTNKHALDFDLHIGFVEEYRIQDAVPDGDLVVLSMREEQCRWLKGAPPKGFLAAAPLRETLDRQDVDRPKWRGIYE